MRQTSRRDEERSELQRKLKYYEKKASELQEDLVQTSDKLRYLRKECTFQKGQVADLELQLVEKTSKFSQITQVLEARGEPTELEALLMQKSVEHAELNLSADRLRLELQQADDHIDNLESENEALKEVNDTLSAKCERTTVELATTKKELALNRSLDKELASILSLLQSNCKRIDKRGKKGHNQETDSLTSHADTIHTLREGIQAIVEDKKRLLTECQTLRRGKSVPKKGSFSHESEGDTGTVTTDQSQSMDPEGEGRMGSAREQGSVLRSQSTPFSVATELLNGAEDTVGENMEDRRFEQRPASPMSESSSSKYDQLKSQLEEAESKLVNMSAEIGKARAAEQECEEATQKMAELENRLSRAEAERSDAYRDMSVLENELKVAESAIDVATSKAKEINETYGKLLSETTSENKSLKEKCDEFESGYSAQMAELEKQVEESERFFQLQCEGLKEQHLMKVDEITTKYEELKEDHEKTIVSQKERFDQLNLEFDTFIEMHTELEDEMKDVQSKYDEALNKIITLEEQLEMAKRRHETDTKKYSDLIADNQKSKEEMQEAAEKAKLSMQEAVINQQKLRRENEKETKELQNFLDAAKKDTEEKQGLIEELKDHACDMEERLKKSEFDSSAKIKTLEDSYSSCLEKLQHYAEKLHDIGLLSDEVPAEAANTPTEECKKVRNKHDVAVEKMNRLEEELMVRSKKTSPAVVTKQLSKFERDLAVILAEVCNKEVYAKSEDESLWVFRLLHQVRFTKIHDEMNLGRQEKDAWLPASLEVLLAAYQRHVVMLRKVHTELQWHLRRQSNGVAVAAPSDFLGHVDKTRVVHAELEELQTRTIAEPNSEDSTSQMINNFLRHQRHLTVLHFDLLAYARASGISDLSVRSGSSIQSLPAILRCCELGEFAREGPNSIDEAKVQFQKLKGEARKIKLAANTSKIRFEAREKEHRVVLFQYKNLLNEFNKINEKFEASADHRDPHKAHVPVTGSELKRLRKDLRAAELKVEMMALELRSTKSKAGEAQRNFEEREEQLQSVLGRCEQLQEEQHSLKTKLQSQVSNYKVSEAPNIFRPPRSPMGRLNHDVPSFDGSQMTSFSEGVSAEGRDEKGDRETMHVENACANGPLLLPTGDSDLNTSRAIMSRMKTELLEAEKMAERAAAKLGEREDDLREVISQYKELKAEYDTLVERSEKTETSNTSESYKMMTQERDAAKAQIVVLESDLAKARAGAKSAKKKQLLREDHLRQVIDQYKTLNKEHKATKEQLQRAIQARSRVQAPLSPHVSVGTAQSKDGKHEKPKGGGNGKSKRKPWFSDIKFARESAPEDEGSLLGNNRFLARVRRV